jgi:hypothetical protein
MPGSVFRAERFVISTQVGDDRRKVFQCQFSKRDGSIFINFPYFRHTVGLLSLVHWPADKPNTTLSLELGGKIASHLAKYSHHPSGRAHFSQDGRIKTLIKKDAMPLSDIQGHLFTIHVWGFSNFDAASNSELIAPPSARRHSVTFDFGNEKPTSVKFVGRLHSDRWLEDRTTNRFVQPIMPLISPDGSVGHGFVCSTLIGWPGETRCLVISCEPSGLGDGGRDSALMFIGGFDSGSAMNDPSCPVSFLAFSYPAENADDLRARLGLIDFVPGGAS